MASARLAWSTALLVALVGACNSDADDRRADIDTPVILPEIESAAPEGPVGSVEGLASVSDLVASGTVESRSAVQGRDVSAELVKFRVDETFRGRPVGSIDVLVLESRWPKLLPPARVVLFLQLLGERDAASILDAAVKIDSNGLFTLSPSPNSVLTFQSGILIAPVGFDSIDAKEPAIVVESPELVNHITVAELTRVSSTESSSAETPPPSLSAEDAAWLAALNDACEAALPGVRAVSSQLEVILASGTSFDPGPVLESLRSLTDRHADLDGLAESTAVSEDLKARWTKAKETLSEVSERLAAAEGQSGKDLRAVLDTVNLLVNDFQLAWLGLDVDNCKQFVG